MASLLQIQFLSRWKIEHDLSQDGFCSFKTSDMVLDDIVWCGSQWRIAFKFSHNIPRAPGPEHTLCRVQGSGLGATNISDAIYTNNEADAIVSRGRYTNINSRR